MNYLFSGKELRKLIIPLVVEQFLTIMIGTIDSIMVSDVGEAAVSAVSLVDSIMILLANLFVALATGGGIIAGQAIGRKRKQEGCESTEQTVLFSVLVGIFVTGIMLLGKNWIFGTVFGNITEDVFRNCNIYYSIVAFSVPFLALYNAGASMYRAMGESKTPMITSFFMNVIHVIITFTLVKVFQIGIAGAGISSLFSRIFSGLVMLWLISNKEKILHIRTLKIKPNVNILKKIMYIGVPFAIESSLFQVGKIWVLSLIASLGTAAIAANAVSGTIAGFAVMAGSSLGVAMSIVTAQCVGAGDMEQVKYYVKKLMKYAYGFLMVVNVLIFLAIPLILNAYQLSDETARIVRQLIIYHSIGVVTIWPLAFMFPNVLRAANDVTYCMIVSIASMWIFRIGFSYLFVLTFQVGVIGVWIAMTLDWVVRGTLFTLRYKSGKWKTKLSA